MFFSTNQVIFILFFINLTICFLNASNIFHQSDPNHSKFYKHHHPTPTHTLSKRQTVQPFAPNGVDESVFQSNPKTDCKIPTLRSTISISSPKTIPAGTSFDCGLDKYQRTDHSCDLDVEKGNQDAVFLLEQGATLQNCFLGYSQES